MNATIHKCPICDWSHTEPMNDIPADALAGVFGMGVMANIAIKRRNERIEEALSGHLKSHPVLDWVKKVVELQSQVERLQRDRESLAGFAAEVAKRFEMPNLKS